MESNKFRCIDMTTAYAKQVFDIENENIECPWTLSAIEQISKNSAAICRVCVDENDEVVGYYTMFNICDEGNINNIAVDKVWQGKGIGNILMQDMTEIAKKIPLSALTLEVNDSNIKAIKLYEKFGFTIEGRRKKFYNNTDDALIMWRK